MLGYRRDTALQGALVWPKVEDWNCETIFCGHYRSIFNHCDIIGLQCYRIRWEKRKIMAIIRVGKYRDIDYSIYSEHLHILPNNSMCACVLSIFIYRWSTCTLVIHTALLWRGAIWQKLSNTQKMLRAKVISQQNTRTVNQNIVTMRHIKK